MGLAPYGKPSFFRPDFVGNWYDISRRFDMPHAAAWWRHCMNMIQQMGYDASALAVKARITEPVNADLAASTQKVFEECYLQAIHSAQGLLLNSRIRTQRLCLSGGTALNCPSNSKIFREGPFDDIFIEPSCSDDGLAIGAALYVHHHLYGNPVFNGAARSDPAFLGVRWSAESVAAALANHADALHVERAENTALRAARDLQENKVIGWYEGGSEAGPRALGHRSIVANPCHAANWRRVNAIKRREWWRPFAPSVLVEEAQRWFSGLPAKSPHMLFTGQVMTDRLPAIRHVDGSARVQTVDPSVGGYYAMIREFGKLSGVPVVLNTSFNGPGEPIVETPEQAIAVLLSTDLDVLYIEGYRVTRAAGRPGT
jgi:carbamoyltransferase